MLGAYQPNYPLAAEIRDAVVLQDDDDDSPVLVDGEAVAWIVLGASPIAIPYAPRALYNR